MLSPLKSKVYRVLAFIFLSLFPVLGFSNTASCADYVRVGIIKDVPSLSLKVSGFYQAWDDAAHKLLYRSKNLKVTLTAFGDGGISFGGKNFNCSRVLIKPLDEDAIVINGRRFRGDVLIIKITGAGLSVINYVEIDDYVKGVLYHEASHYWPQEALKAQAIACRTFALYQTLENKTRDYDVTSDVYSQVYGGRTSERYRISRIVEGTRGKVITYRGDIFPAYYHATCAGHTEDASLLWKINLAPLRGVVCPFCQGSPHFSWNAVLSCVEIRDKLNGAGYPLKEVKDIVILSRDKSARIKSLKIITDNKEIIMPAKDFRSIVGFNIIRSTNFKVRLEGGDVIFTGLGWGHGVGLCQWGAYFMAKEGYDYRQIIGYYYPGSLISAYKPR
ncbi:MAG: SpoIID/LytB domain-containing protein [Candidatus Omnitrophota bacterium]